MNISTRARTLFLSLGFSSVLFLEGCYSTAKESVLLPLRVGEAIAPAYQGGTTEENVRAAIENPRTAARFEEYKRTHGSGSESSGISDIIRGQEMLRNRE